jgi:hypothetical protein
VLAFMGSARVPQWGFVAPEPLPESDSMADADEYCQAFFELLNGDGREFHDFTSHPICMLHVAWRG